MLKEGELLQSGKNLWFTCPKCGTMSRPWVKESEVKCDHCGFSADLSKQIWKGRLEK